MHTTIRRINHTSPAKQAYAIKQKKAFVVHPSRKNKMAALKHQAHQISRGSIKTFKNKPYPSTAIVLSVSLLSGLFIWYKFIK